MACAEGRQRGKQAWRTAGMMQKGRQEMKVEREAGGR